MKIKQGKSLPIPECTLGGKRIIAARTTDLLILDCYKDCVHVGRYLMNVRRIWNPAGRYIPRREAHAGI